ncbi:MAG: hypothetical protein R3D67_04430 [Hyphomicrobiaceae bacterium]
MEILGWIWWLFASLMSVLWTIIWFLLGGWVSTLAQIGVIVLVVFGMKYGWRRAPQEMFARFGTFGRFAWAWLRSKEVPPSAEKAQRAGTGRPEGRRNADRRRQPGDIRINVSTVLSLLMLAGLGVLVTLP